MRHLLTSICFLFLSLQAAWAFDVMDRRGEFLGWEGVGRVDSNTGYCTGTLIARDIVLTAAHCVYYDNGAPIPAEKLIFRAAYHHGKSIARRRVTKWVAAPGFEQQPNGWMSTDMMAHDVALLKLDRQIVSAEADPFKIQQRATPGKTVSVVSYGRGRSEVLSRQARCKLGNTYRGGVVGMDCSVVPGSSGAPVFIKENGRLRILAVISASTRRKDGSKEAFGVLASSLVPSLLAELRQDAARAKPSAGAKRITLGERSAGGARFVRP